MSVYSGIIDLNDLRIKKTIFSKYNVPIKLVIGRIKKLYVKVPWNALSSKPVQIDIEGLELLIEPLEEKNWEDFVNQLNHFEILEKKIIAHSMLIFQELLKNETEQQTIQEQQGFMMNLTSKIIDNIQVNIQNIHIRYEDSINFDMPLSLGLTMEKLQIETTNENWQSQFIDRTHQENKYKPLQKIINLLNIGFYCCPKDQMNRQIHLIETPEEQSKKFAELYPTGSTLSELYKNYYISKPISSLTKLKQLSNHALKATDGAANQSMVKTPSHSKEPIYQITLEIDEISIQLLKSQYEALFKVFEHLNDFQIFTDNQLNKRAIQLKKFYAQKDDYEKNKEIFSQAVIKILSKEVTALSFEGQPIPQEEQVKMQQMTVLSPDISEVYASLIKYENNLRLQKWCKKIVQNNFETLNKIYKERKGKQQNEQQKGSMISYIGSGISWLGGYGSYSQQPQIEESKEEIQTQQQLVEVKEEQFNKTAPILQKTLTQTNRSQYNQEDGGTEFASAFAGDSDDDFQDAVDTEMDIQSVQERNAQDPDFGIELNTEEEIRKISEQILNDLTYSAFDQENLITNFRHRRQNTSESSEDDVPLFRGQFFLKFSGISLINDSNLNTDEMDENQEYNKIYMFAHEFKIEYNHFDAQDLKNKHQIKMSASCKDMGVQVIQRMFENAASMISEVQEEQPKLTTLIHDIIYRNQEQRDMAKDEIMRIDVLFGNQNIKESMISQLQSTNDFIDQEINFKARPASTLYRKECIELFIKFFEIDQGVNDEVKLRALEEYEKLKEAISIQNMFESQGQIQSNMKLVVELNSSVLILPIDQHNDGKLNQVNQSEAWIFNTGNLILNNNKDILSKNWKCDMGYKPINMDLSHISMFYVENFEDWKNKDETKTKQTLKDLNMKLMIMVRENVSMINDPINSPLIKFKISSEEIKLVFNPITYIHLVNIAKCFERPSSDSSQKEKAKIQERVGIFQNAVLIDMVKKKGNTLKYWYEYVAVFSGSYIYFYSIEDSKTIYEITNHFKNTENEESVILSVSNNSNQKKDIPKKIENMLQQIEYEEYFLIKGCQDIKDMKEIIKSINGTDEQRQDVHQMRMINSLLQECILEFGQVDIMARWKINIKKKVDEINQFLGKQDTSESYIRRATTSLTEKQGTQIKKSLSVQQVLGLYDLKFRKFEIVIEGTSQLKLMSKAVDHKTRDVIILSTQKPEQFNREKQTKNISEFENKWKYSISMSNFSLGYQYRQFDDDKTIAIRSVQIEDQSFDDQEQKPRFPMLMKSYRERSKNEYVIKILIKSQSFESPRFQNVLMDNEIKFGHIYFNWNPVSFNRLIRFFRFIRYVEDVVESQQLKIKQSFKIKLQNLHKDFNHHYEKEDDPSQLLLNRDKRKTVQLMEDLSNKIKKESQKMLIRTESQFSSSNNEQRSGSLIVRRKNTLVKSQFNNRGQRAQDGIFQFDKCAQRTTCIEDSSILMAVKLQIQRIKIICIHPQNDSFPVFTKKIDCLFMDYKSFQDHDTIDGHIGNFRILDNTNYPRTLDPYKNFESQEKIPSQQILGFNKRESHNHNLSPMKNLGFESQDDTVMSGNTSSAHNAAISFEMILFHYPLDHACPIQQLQLNKNYDKLVKMNLKQLQINYMQELIFRLNDYFFFQLLGAMTDANPYQDIMSRLENEIDPFIQTQNPASSLVESPDNKMKCKNLISKIEEANLSDSDEQQSNIQEDSRSSGSQLSSSKSSSSQRDSESQISSTIKRKSSNKSSSEYDEEGIPDEEDYIKRVVKSKVLFDFKQDFEEFDLKQYPLTAGLDIMIENPVIVLKDRPYLLGNIEIDLGQISITSKLDYVKGKWKNYPQKMTYVNIMDIDMKSVRIDYDNKSYMITPPFDMKISMERINFTELLDKQFLSDGINFEEFDKSDKITIKSTGFEMNFKKDVYTYFLRCLDLNINYFDNLAPGYQLFNWNSQDFMKYLDLEQEIVQKFKNSFVMKREMNMQFASFSIKINQENMKDIELLSELILYNLNIDIKMYLDYRKDIKLKSQTFYILCKDSRDQQLKNLIVGPILSKRKIKTNKVFYNEVVQSAQNESDFSVDIKMEADGAKVIDVQMQNLKLFLKIDVLYIMSNFFLNNFPQYNQDAKDKPTFFEPDYGNYARFETILNLNDCLICFEQIMDLQALASEGENEDDKPRSFFSKTVAFQGQLQYYLVRERGNSIKEELLDVPSRDILNAVSHKSISEANITNSHKLKTQQVHILDFKPFFCDIKDLMDGGIPLRYIYKRQMISPFNLYYNQTDMIEIIPRDIRALKRKHQKLQQQNKNPLIKDELLQNEKNELYEDKNFKFYTKTELNLDLAEIQISFNDLIILKGIQKKFDDMNQDYAKYLEQNDGKYDSQSNDSDYEMTKEAIQSDYSSEEEKIQPSSKNIRSSNQTDYRQRKKTTQKQIIDFHRKFNLDSIQQNIQKSPSLKRIVSIQSNKKLIKDVGKVSTFDYANEECEVDIDEEAEVQSQRQMRDNIRSKQLKESKRFQIKTSNSQISDQSESDISDSTPQKLDSQKTKSLSNNMQNVKTVPEELKTSEQKLNRGINQMQIVSHGLKFIVINDIDNNFLPVMSTNFSNFKIQWDNNAKQSCLWTDLQSSVNFFNVNIGVWEPFIEKFGVKLMMNQEILAGKQNTQLTFITPLNLNFTEKLVENLHESQNSWQIVNESYENFLRENKNLESQPVVQSFQQQIDSNDRKSKIAAQMGLTMENQHQEAASLKHQFDPKFNEEIITPYVIINKTDMNFTVKRLFEKDKRDLEIATHEKIKQHLKEQNHIQANLYRRKQLINYYKLEEGQIIDYMVDYYHDKFKSGQVISTNDDFNEEFVEDEEIQALGTPRKLKQVMRQIHLSYESKDNIHLDHIGEYKSEYIKICFDASNHRQQKFQENRDIKKIDLNEHGYRAHILREGKYLEKLFYGVKLIDFKKVFTIRTQFQLVNRTGYDYLVHFRSKDYSILKFLESGDSLPLALRINDCKMQIKMIDNSSSQIICSKTGRLKQQEEIDMDRLNDISDFRDQKYRYKNWTAFVPILILKERLAFNDCSYLTNSPSCYTFIRKTIADYVMKDKMIDINLMPPMIVKNCLPFNLTINYLDQDGNEHQLIFKKDEQKNLFCFPMTNSVKVDIFIRGFQLKKDFKIFNLENYNNLEDHIELFDMYGRQTQIYTQISRKETGQRVVFYAKKVIIDSLESDLMFYYKQSSYFGRDENEILKLEVPFIEQNDLKQRTFIIPEGYSEVFTAQKGQYRKECFKIDIETPTTQVEFKLQNEKQSFNYCYSTNVYLASSNEYIYTKITTVNPYYIFVNQSNYSILIEQAEMQMSQPQTLNYQLPMILQPYQRQAFFFNKINPNIPGVDEFIHIKLLDEEISAMDLEELLNEQRQLLMQKEKGRIFKNPIKQQATIGGINYGLPAKEEMNFHKIYNWSSPFMISEVGQFTLQISPYVRKQRLQEQMIGLNLSERLLLTKIMNESKYLRVKCKADVKQAHGSMFIILEEEDEETCEYKIMNNSQNIDIMYCQHIVNNPMWNQRLFIQDGLNVQKCKSGQTQRFNWDSVLHRKILRVSFGIKATDAQQQDLDSLELCELSKDQEFRVIPTEEKYYTQILIPFDKIGHSEELNLKQSIDTSSLFGVKGITPSFMYKIKIQVVTNGYTKFLKITDSDEENKIAKKKESAVNYSTGLKDNLEIKMNMVELVINQITLSFIHQKCELFTIFISKMHTHITETEELKNIKFSIGYLQIDNQAETDPVYPVLLKPRDLEYNIQTQVISLKPREETEKERQEREAQIQSDVNEAKMFQLQIVINNRSSNNGKQDTINGDRVPDVLYIESIMFLLQTLVIKVQFSHSMKVAQFLQHIGRILNKSVHQVHYIFENFQEEANTEPGSFLSPNKGDQLQQIQFADYDEENDDLSIIVGNAFDPNMSEDHDFNALNQQISSLPKNFIRQQYSQSYKKSVQLKQQMMKQKSILDSSKLNKNHFIVEDSTNKKQDRLKNFAKQDLLLSLNNNFAHFSNDLKKHKFKIEAVMMSKFENNWQLSPSEATNMIKNDEWRLFIKEYQSSPTELIVSALNERFNKSENKKGEEKKQGLSKKEIDDINNINFGQSEDDGAILGPLGETIARKILFFSTFEDMEFQMNGLNISNLFGLGNDVQSQLVNFHKETFKFNALKLIGASNLIGNPSRFVSNIGTGVSDFFVKPIQGIKDGGIVGVKDGIMDGSKSLLQNSLMAPVGAMAKITDSLSKGTLALSFDDKYIQEKNQKDWRNKPKSMSDGLKKGFSSAGSSIYSGITGVFTKPMEGARNDGLKGFVKGGAQGAAGLITKTFSGGLDIIAKTSAGLDNQSKGSQMLVAHRIRRPRPFYEVYNIIKPYNEFHSFWVTMVPQLDDQLDISKLYDVFQIHEEIRLIQTDSKLSRADQLKPQNCIQEQQSSIFVITKQEIIHIKSYIQIQPRKRGESEPKIKKARKKIENVFTVKHIDFIDIAGDDNSVIIIGFKQNQKEVQESQIKKTEPNVVMYQGTDGIIGSGFENPFNEEKHITNLNEIDKMILTEDNIERIQSQQNFKGSILTHVDQHQSFLGQSEEDILPVVVQQTDDLQPPQIILTESTSKITPNQLQIFREKLREHVHIQKLRGSLSGANMRVNLSSFHLQIECDDAEKAKEIKSTLQKIKNIHRKEKALRLMMMNQLR